MSFEDRFYSAVVHTAIVAGTRRSTGTIVANTSNLGTHFMLSSSNPKAKVQ